MKSGRYSLAQLLNSDNIEQIIIPEMQRDYVWEPKNVSALLSSIGYKWRNKKSVTLDIKVKDSDIETTIHDYLTKEYERLRFNTRIGFIYAYYDASDSRRLYLIDGQQRITTLFLLLLALYSQRGESSGKSENNFKGTYYIKDKELLKLDYRVRETAHRFLVDFIDYILDNPDGDFRSESEKYYSIYDHDPTVKSILANFAVIKQWVKDQQANSSRLPDLIDYIENFIEFNYFDTGRSRQGERLYLYMNSRGEQLSQQEQIRPTIIQRSNPSEKLKVGIAWEQWQNFFWKHRGENVNADLGFKGFLKVAVILHQAYYFPNVEMKKEDGKQSDRERREDYIKHNLKEQSWWITKYILDNTTFDYEWMETVFNAYKRLSDICDHVEKGDFIGKNPFIRERQWRSAESIEMVHYIPLCGTLMLEIQHQKKNNTSVSDENLYRMAMYLLSRSDNENNSKNSDSATIDAMEMSIAMCNARTQDVRKLSAAPISAKHMNDVTSLMWQRIKEENADAGEWERLYWSIVSEQDLNRFFNSNHDTLILLASPNDDGNVSADAFGQFLSRFKMRFYSRRSEPALRQDLLAYGDISINDRKEIEKNGRKMQQRHIPISDHRDKLWRIYDDWRQSLGDTQKRGIIRAYVNNDESKKKNDGTLVALAIGMHFMNESYYKYFWHKPEGDTSYPDIVLVQSSWTDDAHLKPLPCQILEQAFHGINVPARYWAKGNKEVELYPNACVVDFTIDGNTFVAKQQPSAFAIDFVYKWDAQTPLWNVYLVSRLKESNPADLENPQPIAITDIFDIDKLTEWEKLEEGEIDSLCKIRLRHTFTDNVKDYEADGMLPSIRAILKWYDKAREELTSAYITHI
ncbi:MAG: DUF262 domain-containing protein [Prevotellaceae bacterium]|nr:DUF262 domain-containing protein [Prevotellaceae bacterium]